MALGSGPPALDVSSKKNIKNAFFKNWLILFYLCNINILFKYVRFLIIHSFFFIGAHLGKVTQVSQLKEHEIVVPFSFQTIQYNMIQYNIGVAFGSCSTVSFSSGLRGEIVEAPLF